MSGGECIPSFPPCQRRGLWGLFPSMSALCPLLSTANSETSLMNSPQLILAPSGAITIYDTNGGVNTPGATLMMSAFGPAL